MQNVEPLEHWWNGRWGMARLDVYLETDGRRWLVRAQERQDEKRERRFPCSTEPQARAYLGWLLRTAVAPPEGWRWRDIGVRGGSR